MCCTVWWCTCLCLRNRVASQKHSRGLWHLLFPPVSLMLMMCSLDLFLLVLWPYLGQTNRACSLHPSHLHRIRLPLPSQALVSLYAFLSSMMEMSSLPALPTPSHLQFCSFWFTRPPPSLPNPSWWTAHCDGGQQDQLCGNDNLLLLLDENITKSPVLESVLWICLLAAEADLSCNYSSPRPRLLLLCCRRPFLSVVCTLEFRDGMSSISTGSFPDRLTAFSRTFDPP